MLKLQQSSPRVQPKLQEAVPHICLSPHCQLPLHRLFSTNHPHFLQKHCQKWILPFHDLLQLPIPLTSRDLRAVFVDFEGQPLAAMRVLERVRLSDWKRELQQQQAKMKKEIVKIIETEFEAIHQQFSQLLQTAHLLEEIRRLADAPSPAEAISSHLRANSSWQKLPTNHVLFDRVQLKEKTQLAKSSLAEAVSTLLGSRPTPIGVLNREQELAFREFIFEECDQYFNKLQILSAALNKPTPQYDYQNERFQLKCPLCTANFNFTVNPASKKQVKKQLAEQILLHLYSQHLEEAGFAYCRKVAKMHLEGLTFEEFLAVSQPYPKVRIVDRESGVVVEENYKEAGIFTVEIVSIQQIPMAKGRHIVVSTREAVDSLASVICYACTQRNQDVLLSTNKPALRSGINAILHLERPESKEENAM